MDAARESRAVVLVVVVCSRKCNSIYDKLGPPDQCFDCRPRVGKNDPITYERPSNTGHNNLNINVSVATLHLNIAIS